MDNEKQKPEEEKDKGQEDDVKLKLIKGYKNEIRKRQLYGIWMSVAILSLCIAMQSFLIVAVVGWISCLKVVDTLPQAVLISWMIILTVIAVWVVYQMYTAKNRYRKALLRLDSLILRLKFDENGDKEIGWVERELLLITRIMESSAAECNVGK